jgi:hypothetical protein
VLLGRGGAGREATHHREGTVQSRDRSLVHGRHRDASRGAK